MGGNAANQQPLENEIGAAMRYEIATCGNSRKGLNSAWSCPRLHRFQFTKQTSLRTPSSHRSINSFAWLSHRLNQLLANTGFRVRCHLADPHCALMSCRPRSSARSPLNDLGEHSPAALWVGAVSRFGPDDRSSLRTLENALGLFDRRREQFWQAGEDYQHRRAQRSDQRGRSGGPWPRQRPRVGPLISR